MILTPSEQRAMLLYDRIRGQITTRDDPLEGARFFLELAERIKNERMECAKEAASALWERP